MKIMIQIELYKKKSLKLLNKETKFSYIEIE